MLSAQTARNSIAIWEETKVLGSVLCPEMLSDSEQPLWRLFWSALTHSEGCTPGFSLIAFVVYLQYLPIDQDYRNEWPRWNITGVFLSDYYIPLLLPTAFNFQAVFADYQFGVSAVCGIAGKPSSKGSKRNVSGAFCSRPDNLREIKAIGLRSSWDCRPILPSLTSYGRKLIDIDHTPTEPTASSS